MRKNINKLATLVMTGALAATMSFSAFADEATFAGKIVNITKTVTTDPANKTFAPNTSFKLNVTAGEAASNKALVTKDADGKTIENASTFEVYAGVGEESIKVTPADFTDGEYTTLADNKGYKDNFTVKVPNSIFTKPGVYAYKLKEVDDQYKGVNYDQTEYDMYVFVVNNADNTGYEVSGIVVSKPDGTKIGGGSDANFSDPEGIINNYGYEGTEENPIPDGDTTHDLTIKKLVSGNAGDKNKEFHFAITVTPDEANEQFLLVDKNGNEVTTFKSGSYNYTATVVDGSELHLTGLTVGDKIEVKEVEAESDGYTSTYVIENNAKGDVNKNVSKTSLINEDKTVKTVEVFAVNDGATLTIENNRNNVTPTGVAMDIAPYALMVALAGGAAATFLRKKESFED